MPGPMRTTIERLDRPSAYYLGRVSRTSPTCCGNRESANNIWPIYRTKNGSLIGIMMTGTTGTKHRRNRKIH